MKHHLLSAAAVAAVVMLPACETIENNSELVGAGLGALAGAGACALSSANDTECALLVIGGAVAGYAVASYIDRDDETTYQQATNDVLVDGQSTSTRTSPSTGNTVTVARQPDGAYKDSQGRDCTRVTVNYQGEDHQEAYCKDAADQWQPVDA